MKPLGECPSCDLYYKNHEKIMGKPSKYATETDDKDEDTQKEIVKIWTDRMDATFEKYIKGKLPPQRVTNDKEVLSILLGMGLAEFVVRDNGFHVQSKGLVDVFWNGDKFEIRTLSESQT